MGSFNSFQRQKREQTVSPTSSFAGLTRPFVPIPSPSFQSVSLAAQTSLEHTKRLGHSLERISIFPPEKKNNTGMPDGLKTGIETLSGISIGDVKVHYNSSKPAQMQALAYTQGRDIHVGPGQQPHLPHEVWHAVQQKQGRVKPMTQTKGVAINDDQELEREADVMGGKAITVRSVEELPYQLAQSPGKAEAGVNNSGDESHPTQFFRYGENNSASAYRKWLPAYKPMSVVQQQGAVPSSNVIQKKKVDTLGGTFEEHKYSLHSEKNDHQKEIFGADMWLDFCPSKFVQSNADMIGLVQTVNTLKSTPNDVPKIPSTPEESPAKAAYKLKIGDVGRGIDQFDVSEFGKTNTNPLYASQNKHDYSKNLKDTNAAPGFGQHWDKSRKAEPAKLIDRPRSVLEFPDQAWRQTFEVTALVVAGKFSNVYLGSIEWGVEKPAGQNPVLNPSSIRLVRVGTPSTQFMEAANSWNTWNDGKRNLTRVEQEREGKDKVDVVPLPLTTNIAYSHHLMPDSPDELIIYMAQAQNVLTQDGVRVVDRANTEFNLKAMANQLVKLKGGEEFFGTYEKYISEQLSSSFAHLIPEMQRIVFDAIIEVI